jgi:hypothetical protein
LTYDLGFERLIINGVMKREVSYSSGGISIIIVGFMCVVAGFIDDQSSFLIVVGLILIVVGIAIKFLMK